MKTRVITGVVIAVLLLALCYFSATPTYYICISLLSAVGVYEMTRCIGVNKKLCLAIPSVILALITGICAKYCGDLERFAVVFISCVFIYLLLLFAFSVFSKGKVPVDEVFAVFSTTLYIVMSFSSLILLRDRESGQYLILIAIFMPLISDVFAYFCGYLFGKHKLIPDVSPKKTVEGCIGGLFFCGVVCSVFGCVVCSLNGGTPDITIALRMFAVGLIVSAISQVGDLVASVIKRRYGIKDYGKILPGHGGVLDRFDSVMATSTVILIMTLIPSLIKMVE